MLTSYAGADLIRSYEPDVFDSSFTDAQLRLWARQYADPIIDGRLGSMGYSVPLAITTFTDLAATDPWTTVSSAIGGFTGSADLKLVILSGTNFTADEYRIASVTDDNTAVLTSASGAGGVAAAGIGFLCDADKLIRRVSAMFAVAHGLNSIVSSTVSAEAARATLLKENAWLILDKIAAGDLKITGASLSALGGKVVVEPFPEDRSAAQVFSGDVADYDMLAETRGS